MTKAQDTTETVATPALDLSTLSVKELADMLAKARQAEKAAKAATSTLPMFAFVVAMDDSSLVYWSGRADTFDAAKDLAIAYAERDGDKAFRYADCVSVMPRPIPAPRGRKAKVDVAI